MGKFSPTKMTGYASLRVLCGKNPVAARPAGRDILRPAERGFLRPTDRDILRCAMHSPGARMARPGVAFPMQVAGRGAALAWCL